MPGLGSGGSRCGRAFDAQRGCRIGDTPLPCSAGQSTSKDCSITGVDVVAVADSLPGAGSAVAELTVAVSTIIVGGAAASTVTTRLNTAGPPVKLALVQVTVPVAPTAGVVHDQPPGDASEVNVVLAGITLLIDTLAAALGPLLSSVIV